MKSEFFSQHLVRIKCNKNAQKTYKVILGKNVKYRRTNICLYKYFIIYFAIACLKGKPQKVKKERKLFSRVLRLHKKRYKKRNTI